MTIYHLDLIEELRDRLSDVGGDRGTVPTGYYRYWQYNDDVCLWRNRELVRNLNWAITEVGRRNPILDVADTFICKIGISAGKRIYDLDPRIMTIEEVSLASTGQTLKKTTVREQERLMHAGIYGRTFVGPDWRNETGDVTHYLEDEQNRKISLYRNPTASDTLLMTVYRQFLDEIVWDDIKQESVLTTEFCEFPDDLREALIVGAESRCYRKNDSDTHYAQLAGMKDQEFAQWVGPPVDLRTLENRRRNANLELSMTPYPYTRRMRRARTSSDTGDADL